MTSDNISLFSINENGTQYTIALDDLDLNLPINRLASSRLDHTVKPFWSLKRLNEKKYCEFELKAEKRNAGNGGSIDNSIQSAIVLQNFEVSKCYICNIDVPKIYFKEHIISNKHKINTTIANNALERIKKHISEVIICTDDIKTESTHFCDSCVLVVSYANKANHENSEIHLASIERDKLLKDLSNLYTEEIKVDIKDKKVNKVHNEAVTLLKLNKDNANIEVNNKENQKTAENESDSTSAFTFCEICKINVHTHNMSSHVDGNKHKKNLKKCNTGDDNSIIITDESTKKKEATCTDENLKFYIKYISNKIGSLHSISYLNKEYIEIKTENGDRIKIHVNNFHSFSNSFSVARTFCKLCWLFINDNDLEEHKHTDMHIQNIMMPLRDGDCIRKIKLNELSGVEWSHCILCNQRVVTINVDTHISSQIHINYKKKSTISTEKEMCLANDKNIEAKNQCIQKKNTQEVKNENVPDNITNKKGNLKNEEVTSELSYIEMITNKIPVTHSISPLNDKFIRIKTENGTLIKVHIDNLHSYSCRIDDKDKSIKYCQLCNLFLGCHERNAHKMSMEHIKNVMLPLKDKDCIRKLAGIWTHCLLCNERVPVPNVNGHIIGQTHEDRRKEAIVGNSDDSKTTEGTYMKLESHLKEKVLSFINVNNEDKLIETPALSTPESNEEELREYIELISKKIQAEHSLLVLDKNVIEVRATNGDRVKVDIDGFHSYNCKDRHNAYCFLCSVHLSGDNIKKHKYIMEHITKIMATIKDRHCIRQFENSFHCMLCNMKIANTKTAIEHHKQDRDHYDLLKEALITTPNTSDWEEINETTNITFYPTFMMKNNKNLTIAHCDVCDLDIQTHNMNSHLNSKKHTMNQNNKTQDSEVQNQTEIQTIANTSETVSIIFESETENSDIRNKMGLEQYITFLNSKIPVENTLTALDDITLEIEAKNGNRLNIHVDNYHGYQRCGMQKICMLCSENLLEDDEKHKVTLNHMKNISFPINDRHCMRKVMSNTEYIHCMLCNELVTNSTVNIHIRNEKHKGLLKIAFKSKASPAHKEEPTLIIKKNKLTYIGDAFFCQLCNVKVAVNAVINHLNDENHKIKITINNIYDKPRNNFPSIDVKNVSKPVTQFTDHNIDTNNNAKKETIHYLVKYSADSNLICKVCGAKFVNNTYNLNLHINDSAHKEAYMTLINKNKLRYNEDAYFCQLCNVKVAVNAVLLHLNDENHKTKITLNNNFHKNKNNSPTVDVTNICKPVTDVVRNIDAESKAMKKTLHYLMEYSTDSNHLICKVCCAKLINSTSELNLHIKDSAHQEKYLSMINKNRLTYKGNAYFCQLCNVTVAVRAVMLHFNDNNHISKINSVCLKETTSNLIYYFCDVCKVNVPNNTKNVDEHLKGASHGKRYNTIISRNKLTKSGDKYFCEVCKVDVAVTTLIFHVNDENHKFKLNYGYLMMPSSDFKFSTCKVCKVSVLNTIHDLMEHAKGSIHEKAYNSMIIKNKLTKKENIYYCEVCNVKIDETAELLHIYDDDHKRKLDFCHICKVEVGANNMIPHIAGKKHKEMEKLKTETEQSTSQSHASYYCDICKVEFPKNELHAHKNGYDHVNNLKKHTITFSNNIYSCEICQSSISESNLFEHVTNVQHTTKLCVYNLCVSLTSYIANN